MKPALVCINNGTNTITRYVPKPTGGFFTERYEIVDRDAAGKGLTRDMVEAIRLGNVRDAEGKA